MALALWDYLCKKCGNKDSAPLLDSHSCPACGEPMVLLPAHIRIGVDIRAFQDLERHIVEGDEKKKKNEELYVAEKNKTDEHWKREWHRAELHHKVKEVA